ncbi:MAG: M20/M25/M40 family metallo-hydrolase, partial [Phenylobacterium sp.]|uniref:M20/M25/M40 family metallo-hydrolase n=1 Tax=Phenylobacterium sp. TaxID=1871053 RepID=UPI00391DE2A0
MTRWFALIAALVAAFLLARAAEQTPPPAPASAPPTTFSAERAMADVRVVARAPHPIGSPENAAVRDHLLARLQALGLEGEIQRAPGQFHRTFNGETFVAGGTVENVIGILPGRDRTAPAVALMAHYDSVPGSPGAADDAAGVAAILEIARALKAEGTPARDVVLLLTDGEEAGLLGAEAFFAQHPLARRIGFMINLEARGGGGRAQMFQTGPDNRGAVDLYRRNAISPESSSLAVFLYETMPNDTDFTVSKEAGAPGLNFAFIGRQFDYHMPSSTPENLDRGSLQHLGQEALAVARAAAFAPALPQPGPDLVYSTTFGDRILAYPPNVGWGVLAAAALLALIGFIRARRREPVDWRDMVKGLGVGLFLIAFSAALLRFARRAATEGGQGFLDQHVLLAQVTRWEIALALLATGALLYASAAVGRGRTRLPAAALALAAGFGCSAFGGWDPIGAGLGGGAALLALASFGRPGGVAGVWSGLLLTGLAAGVALQILAPPAAFVVAWPLAVAGLAAAASAMGAARGVLIAAVLAVLTGLGISWILGYAHGVFLGLDMPELLAAFAWLAALVVWPLAQPGDHEKSARPAALIVIAAGLAGLALVRLDPPWTERHPKPVGAAYHVEPAAGRAHRVVFTPFPDDWTQAVLGADDGEVSQRRLTGFRRPVAAAPAPVVDAQAPTVTLTRGEDGLLTLRAVPPAGARTLLVDLKASVPMTAATLDGRPVDMLQAPDQWARLRWIATPEGVVLVLRPSGPGGGGGGGEKGGGGWEEK